jgi:hypothetical protein
MSKARSTERQTAVHVEGVTQLLRALSKIDKDLQANVRDASQAIANDLVASARGAAHTRLQALAASALTAKRDRVPVVKVGTSMVRPGTSATDIFYGAEFGGGKRPTTRQFPAHKGRQGYFLYPQARAHSSRYMSLWADAIDEAFEAWNSRGLGI